MENLMKYKLTEQTLRWKCRILHRIESLIDFDDVKVGDKGGWIECENNLSQKGVSWVYNNAKVYDYAKVYNNAKVCGRAEVYGHAEVYENAEVHDYAKVYGAAKVDSYATVFGNAVIKSNRDYIVFKNWWSSGRYFIWTRSNNKWKVGCFYGTSKELVSKAYNDSKESGREYERIVKYVESILNEEKEIHLNGFSENDLY